MANLGELKVTHKRQGFTIVELLIVVVVIAILAAITIVAYNGIQDRTKQSVAQNSAAQMNKKVLSYAVENADLYPSDEDTLLTYANTQDGSGQSASASSAYQYTASADRKSFCLTTTTRGLSYYVSNTSSIPTRGACAGHGADGVVPITNYAMNPSAVGSITGFGQAGASPASNNSVISAVQVHHGSTSLRKDITGTGQTGASAQTNPASRPRVNVGQQFFWSLWVYSTKAGNLTAYCDGYRVSDSVGAGLTGGSVSVPANTWVKLTGVATAAVDMYIIQCGGYNLSVVSGDTVWFDEFMLTNGNTANYADGSTAGWAWSGASNVSYSTGPPV